MVHLFKPYLDTLLMADITPYYPVATHAFFSDKGLTALKVVILALVLMAISDLSQAQSTSYKSIYKSVGKFGEPKFSQFAPEANIKFEVIEMRSDGIQSQPGSLAAEDTINNANSLPTSASRAKLGTPSSVPASATKAQCQKLTSNLTNLQAGGQIYESIAGGQRRYLNPVEVTLKVEDTQQLLAQYCKGHFT